MFAPRSIKHCRAQHSRVPHPRRRQPRPRDLHRLHDDPYENPLNVVGTLPVRKTRCCLPARIDPRRGLWTLPAGFMERGETTEEGALRETVEEAGARVELQGLYSLLNVVRVGQVHLFYRARMLDLDFVPGPESLEARLFAEDEVPWDEIAFRTTRKTLEFFFADRREGRFAFHAGDIA
jgi:ADP-ribose pyrophosphatase YjhB (NUDIX family)